MISMTCSECKTKSQDGVLEHLDGCSVKQPTTVTTESRMPPITLNFDTPEEQAEWLRKLKGGSSEHLASSELVHPTPLTNSIKEILKDFEQQVLLGHGGATLKQHEQTTHSIITKIKESLPEKRSEDYGLSMAQRTENFGYNKALDDVLGMWGETPPITEVKRLAKK